MVIRTNPTPDSEAECDSEVWQKLKLFKGVEPLEFSSDFF